MNERKRLWFVNWPLLLIVAALAVYGSLMVQSATSGMVGASGLFKRHLLGLAIGLVPAGRGVGVRLPQAPGMDRAASAAGCAAHPVAEDSRARRDRQGRDIVAGGGGIRLFQPSEPAKLVTIIVMAAIIATYKGKIERPVDLAKVLAILAVPLGLILLQPDLGTGMVFVAITAGMLLIGGLKPRWFVVLGIAGVVLVGGMLSLNTTLDKALER